MLIDTINVAEWFRPKSPSLTKCKEGDRSPSFEHFQLDMYAIIYVTESSYIRGNSDLSSFESSDCVYYY